MDDTDEPASLSPGDDRAEERTTNAAQCDTDEADGRYRVLRYREEGSDQTVIQDRRNEDAWIQTDAAVTVRE